MMQHSEQLGFACIICSSIYSTVNIKTYYIIQRCVYFTNIQDTGFVRMPEFMHRLLFGLKYETLASEC